jgi:hypothetical protein
LIQKDYILRLIEEAAKVLAIALKLKDEGDFDAAEQALENAYGDILKIDKKDVLFVSNNELIPYLTNGLKMENGKLEILANFFTEDSFFEKNTETKRNLTQKALILLQHINKTDKTFSFERINKTERLKKTLENL